VDGVLMIGWHARAKTRGVLAHTSNSAAFARVWLGGLELGEVGLYAALAGEFGVPVLMASGCDVMADELRTLLPQAACAVVKWSEGARSGRSLSPASARDLIETAARDAVQSLGSTGPHACSPWRLPAVPPTLRVQCQTPALADAFALWPGVQREDAETIVVASATVQDAVRSLNALSVMAIALR
jgi:D-amino peptidase